MRINLTHKIELFKKFWHTVKTKHKTWLLIVLHVKFIKKIVHIHILVPLYTCRKFNNTFFILYKAKNNVTELRDDPLKWSQNENTPRIKTFLRSIFKNFSFATWLPHSLHPLIHPSPSPNPCVLNLLHPKVIASLVVRLGSKPQLGT